MDQIWGPKKFFSEIYLYQQLEIALSYQFKGKLMNQTWEKSKKRNIGPGLGLFCPKLGPQKTFFMSFTSTRCYALLQAII